MLYVNFKHMENSFLTIKEAAKMLRVSALTLRNWDKSGKFEASRHPLNNYRVYRKDDVEALLEDIKSGSYTIKNSRKQVKKLSIKHLED